MKLVRGVELKQGSNEELLPEFPVGFPHISSRVELDKYTGQKSPWRWHKEIELFFMEQGGLDYDAPQGKTNFPVGSGGLVNSNVLRMSRVKEARKPATAFLHLFSPVLISGYNGSIIDQKYVAPFITAANIEILAFYPDNPKHRPILDLLRKSFQISEQDQAYEIRLRNLLSELWRLVLELSEPLEPQNRKGPEPVTR